MVGDKGVGKRGERDGGRQQKSESGCWGRNRKSVGGRSITNMDERTHVK